MKRRDFLKAATGAGAAAVALLGKSYREPWSL